MQKRDEPGIRHCDARDMIITTVQSWSIISLPSLAKKRSKAGRWKLRCSAVWLKTNVPLLHWMYLGKVWAGAFFLIFTTRRTYNLGFNFLPPWGRKRKEAKYHDYTSIANNTSTQHIYIYTKEKWKTQSITSSQPKQFEKSITKNLFFKIGNIIRLFLPIIVINVSVVLLEYQGTEDLTKSKEEVFKQPSILNSQKHFSECFILWKSGS